MNDRYGQIERLRKLIDKIAYYSLSIDITIALITSLSLLHISGTDVLLIPVNYALTAVVVLSIGLFIVLFYLKHEQKILDNLLGRKYKYRKSAPSIAHRMQMKKIYARNRKMLD